MTADLFLHHEILLLALRDDKGTSLSGMHTYAMAGAILSELFLAERIIATEDKKQIIAVVNDSPIGEPLLDEFLSMIGESKKNRKASDWITRGAQIKELHHRVAKILCDKGILEKDERKILFLFTQRIYPELNGSFEDAIRDRMANVMFNEKELPDERTAVLIALASHCSLLTPNFAPVELKQHKARIKELAEGKILAAGATKAVIEAVQAAAIAASMVPIMVAATTN